MVGAKLSDLINNRFDFGLNRRSNQTSNRRLLNRIESLNQRLMPLLLRRPESTVGLIKELPGVFLVYPPTDVSLFFKSPTVKGETNCSKQARAAGFSDLADWTPASGASP